MTAPERNGTTPHGSLLRRLFRRSRTRACDRSAMSYEREIRSLSRALSDESANSYRLAQEARELGEALDAVALREHLTAHPTPPSGPPPGWEKVEVEGELSPPKTTMFRKPDGSPLIEITLTHTFSKMTGLRGRRTS